MSVEILTGSSAGSDNVLAVMYDNTTMRAFGPVVTGDDAEEKAEAFLEWLRAGQPWGTLSAQTWRPQFIMNEYAKWFDKHTCARCSVLLQGADTVHERGCAILTNQGTPPSER